MKRSGIIFLLLAMVVSAMPAAEASFRYIPLEQLVERNPVTITGKVVKIKGTGSLLRRGKGYDLAIIQADAVLKNETGDPAVRVGTELPLAMPSEIRESGEFRHKKGAEGVWLLSRDARTGQYRTRHPDQLQPMSKKAEIIALIAQQKKEQTDAMPGFQLLKKQHAESLAACSLYTLADLEADLAKTPGPEVEMDKLSYERVDDNGNCAGYVFVDAAGKVRLATRYYVTGPFNEGLAPVGTALGKHSVIINYGFIDRNGKLAFKPVYDSVEGFSEGLAFVYTGRTNKERKCGAVDKAGTVVIPMDYDYALSPFQDGTAVVSKGEKALCIDRNGSVLGQMNIGDRWFKWRNGYFPKGHSLYDSKLKDVIDVSEESLGYEIFELDRVSDGRVAVDVFITGQGRSDRRWGFIDMTGKWAVPPEYLEVGEFSEGLAAVVKEAKDNIPIWGYVDTSGEMRIEPAYSRAESFSEGLAAVEVLAWADNPQKPVGIMRVSRWGYVDRTGRLAIPAWFTTARPFRNGIAFVREPGMSGFINKTGKYVWRTAK